MKKLTLPLLLISAFQPRNVRCALAAFYVLFSFSAFSYDQVFSYTSNTAASVELMAEFDNWSGRVMTKNGSTFTVTVSNLAPGFYAYKFLVDGAWILDPNNGATKVTAGITNSGVAVNVPLSFLRATYTSTFNIDFSGPTIIVLPVTGDLTLTTSGGATGAAREVCLYLVGDGTQHALTTPGGWTFFNSTAPSSLVPNAKAWLSLISTGAGDSNVVATFQIKP